MYIYINIVPNHGNSGFITYLDRQLLHPLDTMAVFHLSILAVRSSVSGVGQAPVSLCIFFASLSHQNSTIALYKEIYFPQKCRATVRRWVCTFCLCVCMYVYMYMYTNMYIYIHIFLCAGYNVHIYAYMSYMYRQKKSEPRSGVAYLPILLYVYIHLFILIHEPSSTLSEISLSSHVVHNWLVTKFRFN